MKPRVWHTVTPDVALCTHLFVYCVFIIILHPPLFFFGWRWPPRGSFNPTITHRSTISARASAGRIRVTWAVPDCNQSKNNECRTKAGIITLSWRSISLSFPLFPLFVSSFSPRVWREVGGNTDGRGRRLRQQACAGLHDQGLANEPITWRDSTQLTYTRRPFNILHNIITCVCVCALMGMWTFATCCPENWTEQRASGTGSHHPFQ